MRGFSKAIITGNLTRDPELRTTANGSNVCSFSVAVNRVYKDSSGEQKEDVSYIDCSAWGRLGEMISQYAKKGSGVLVSGRLDQRSWEDKTDGKKRSRVEIVVEDFNFVGAPRGDGMLPVGFLPRGGRYRHNESALTTGFERGIPAGLVIGELVSVENMETRFSSRLYLSGWLRPAAEFDRVRFVVIALPKAGKAAL
jgi:single-strand DNA-binding protein